MGFTFISVHKDIRHGFNHSEVNRSYSAVLMQLHKARLSLDTNKKTDGSQCHGGKICHVVGFNQSTSVSQR
jgi:hypothetical protein